MSTKIDIGTNNRNEARRYRNVSDLSKPFLFPNDYDDSFINHVNQRIIRCVARPGTPVRVAHGLYCYYDDETVWMVVGIDWGFHSKRRLWKATAHTSEGVIETPAIRNLNETIEWIRQR